MATINRLFTIGGSDYSNRVVAWPKFQRATNKITSVNVTVPLLNADGEFNTYYNDLYTIEKEVVLKIDNPDGDILTTVFIGYIKKVSYKGRKCTVTLRDKLSDFFGAKVGDSVTPVTFSGEYPSDIVWTICTSYGGLDSTQDSSNTDIDYPSFETWAGVFEENNIYCSANFEGTKITKILEDVAKLTNTTVFIERTGKLSFRRFMERGTQSIVITESDRLSLEIDVNAGKIINKQDVYYDYNTDSSAWVGIASAGNISSQNSYGIYEDIMKIKNIWFDNENSAATVAQQIVLSYAEPPRIFKIKTTLHGIDMQLVDNVRIVDSFFNIDSSSLWRITDYIFDTANGNIQFGLNSAVSFHAFYLDVDILDSEEAKLVL